MTERPILFSAPMVWALLAGRKTQTRRVMNPQPTPHFTIDVDYWTSGKHAGELGRAPRSTPYGVPGDRLWVREPQRVITIRESRLGTSDLGYVSEIRVECLADGVESEWIPYPQRMRWQPKMFALLPRGSYRESARLTFELTAVRVERVQDITIADAMAEGFARVTKDGGVTYKYGIPDRDGLPGTDDLGWPWREWETDPRVAYTKLWDRINAARGYPWSSNPWVWVLTFRRVESAVQAA